MTAATGSSLEHAIGADGLLAIRLRDGEVRLRAVDGDTVRVRDANGHDLADMFAIEAAAGSLSLKAGRGLEIIVGSPIDASRQPPPNPGPRDRPAAWRHARPRSRERRHRGRRAAAVTSATAPPRATSCCAP